MEIVRVKAEELGSLCEVALGLFESGQMDYFPEEKNGSSLPRFFCLARA